MSLWSQTNARLILDRLCEHPSVTASAKLIGASSKLIWIWARNSARSKALNETDSKYIVNGWPDDSDDSMPIWFHEGIDLARKIHALNLDHDTREMLNGVERPVVTDGAFTYVVDPLAIAQWPDKKSAEDFGGYVDWPFAHDENGARIVLTVREQPPAQLKIHALRALMGGIYNIPEKRTVETTSQASVLVLHGDVPPRANREATPLVQDLRERLEAIRRDPNRPSAKPNAPVAINRDSSADPRENVNGDAGGEPPIPPTTFRPAPKPVPPPTPSYARPKNPKLDREDSRDGPPPGGFPMRGRSAMT